MQAIVIHLLYLKISQRAGRSSQELWDPVSCNFIMEGGAMVLTNGGCRRMIGSPTISIAKAGITTTLNSRCSVLAAANSVYSQWNDTKGEENIDFMPTILSRFNMIFIVKDEHNEQRDMTLVKHVMNVHLSAWTQKVCEKRGGFEYSEEIHCLLQS